MVGCNALPTSPGHAMRIGHGRAVKLTKCLRVREDARASVFQLCTRMLLRLSHYIDTAELHEGAMFSTFLGLLTALNYVNLRKK